MSEEVIQQELPLPFPDLAADLPLLPARMVNDWGVGGDAQGVGDFP